MSATPETLNSDSLKTSTRIMLVSELNSWQKVIIFQLCFDTSLNHHSHGHGLSHLFSYIVSYYVLLISVSFIERHSIHFHQFKTLIWFSSSPSWNPPWLSTHSGYKDLNYKTDLINPLWTFLYSQIQQCFFCIYIHIQENAFDSVSN